MKSAEDPVIVVSVPARAEFVHVLRSTVASTAARLSLTLDEVDDLRLAVDEACAGLLALADQTSTLTVRIVLGEDSVEIVAATDAEASMWPPDGHETTLAWHVISSLIDEARFERWQGDPSIRLVKRSAIGEPPH